MDKKLPLVSTVKDATKKKVVIHDTDVSTFYRKDMVPITKEVTTSEQIGMNIMAWSEGLPSRPDNSNLPPIVSILMAIQYDKEGHYGSSWKGKGEYRGIMANIDRKYDRLDKMTQDEVEGIATNLKKLEAQLQCGHISADEVGESKIDAIADLANYCLLYMTYVKENYPGLFNVWVNKNVPKYLADKIPFIQD